MQCPQDVVEIVVVFFGILSAFTLECGRDERSRDREEFTILLAALTGLRADQGDIDYNVARHQGAVASPDLIN